MKKIPPLSKIEIGRFWGKVSIQEPSQCWPWSAYLLGGGYGQITIQKWPYRAHRLAYFINTGDDPLDLNVLHSCDNPPCCNPAHLFKGSHDDNQKDKWAKGRGWVYRGEKSNFSKLKTEQVVSIRQRIGSGESAKQIAADVGVSPANIRLIGQGKTWKAE